MVDDETLKLARQMLGYTDAQWETWKKNPRNLRVLENLESFRTHKLVAEVVSSHGCAAGHKVGDRIVFAGDGTLLCRENPDRICYGLLSPMIPHVNSVLDKISNGEDPTRIAFNRVHCVDVGVEAGGWGAVVVELKVERS